MKSIQHMWSATTVSLSAFLQHSKLIKDRVENGPFYNTNVFHATRMDVVQKTYEQ